MEAHRHWERDGDEEVAMYHYLNFTRKAKRLTLKDEKQLLARSRSGGRQATEALVDANQIMVLALSESYDDDRLTLMDRIAEGNVALISACRTYLPQLGGSFRRYCQQEIRKAIEHALADVANLRVVVWESATGHAAVSNGRVASRLRFGPRCRARATPSASPVAIATETRSYLARKAP